MLLKFPVPIAMAMAILIAICVPNNVLCSEPPRHVKRSRPSIILSLKLIQDP